MKPSLETDRALINELGGVTKVAEELHISVQRVSNWNRRGIPSKVKLDHPDLFLRDLKNKAKREKAKA